VGGFTGRLPAQEVLPPLCQDMMVFLLTGLFWVLIIYALFFLSRDGVMHILNVFILIQTFAELHSFRDIKRHYTASMLTGTGFLN
jgi:hypothetical protein